MPRPRIAKMDDAAGKRAQERGDGRGPIWAMSVVLLAFGSLGPAVAQAAPREQPDIDTHLRVLHASPYVKEATASVGRQVIARGIRFGVVSRYRRLAAGDQVVNISPSADSPKSAPFEKRVNLAAGTWNTLVLAHQGGPDTPESVLTVRDQFPPLPRGASAVRLLHLADGEPTMELAVDEQRTKLRAGPFAASVYAPTPPGLRSLVTYQPGGSGALLATAGSLAAGTLYTVAAVGGVERPLRLVVIPDAAQPERLPPGERINTGDRGPPPYAYGWGIARPFALGAVLLSLLVIGVKGKHSHFLGIGAGLIALTLVACTSQDGSGASPSTTGNRGTEAPPRSRALPSESPPSTPSAAIPVSVTVPSLHVGAPIVRRSFSDAEKLYDRDYPRYLNGRQVAWLTGSHPPRIAGMGVTVLAGHVRFGGQDGVFRDLDLMRRGDRVLVRLSDGHTLAFVVRRVGQYPKTSLPPETFGPTAESEVRLVSCGGAIGPDGLHRDNVIVFASLDA